MFNRNFNRDRVLRQARDTKAVSRLRDIHPLDFSIAITGCALGDETRSIASARRMFGGITGFMPEESSFYDRFNPGTAKLMKELFLQALDLATTQERKEITAALGGRGILDIWATDATQIRLPASAAEAFPATNEDQGGLKVTTTLSLLFQRIKRVDVTFARMHDRKALHLPRWLHGVLMLFDMGYFDRRLFVDIEKRGGFFVTRLKGNSIPKIVKIRSGLGKNHLDLFLDGNRPYRGIVDVDTNFAPASKKSCVFRVVRVPVVIQERDGSFTKDELWFVTNLPAELFPAETIATLYRYRWEIEKLFWTLKTVGRLDQLKSANADVIHTFLYATLLGIVLAHDICAQMRRARPGIEPSVFRVLALLLQYLPLIIDASGTDRLPRILQSFEQSLWREGRNPNPGRHYKTSIYSEQLRNVA
jgi:putative transposase